jgi:hypothetical protein
LEVNNDAGRGVWYTLGIGIVSSFWWGVRKEEGYLLEMKEI